VLIVREAGGQAYTWDKDRWHTIQRFVAPTTKTTDKKPKTLRDLVKPVLVATHGAAAHVASGLPPHRRPPRAVMWAFRKRRTATKWLAAHRPGAKPPEKKPAPGPTADQQTAPGSPPQHPGA